ncbi:DUF106 domain-containing protein [Candidatus Woesearchaeota archaeon]|nr:DUF106 domain-containing protein [Candidatus Woesearchaeota archaeon]
MAFLDPIFNPVMLPILNFNPFLGIVILALIITLIVTLAYKFFSNQDEMKRLKDKQKEFQDKIKLMRDKPEEMMKMQKEAMTTNFEYMKHSIKPTLITMIPILIIFAWMTGHLSYEPIFPDESYSVTAVFKEGVNGYAEIIVDDDTEVLSEVKQEIKNKEAVWSLRSKEGDHEFLVKSGEAEQSKKVLITTVLSADEAVTVFDHSDIEQLKINYNKLRPLGKKVSLFGWYPGWLAWYIILSILFSIGLRKVLKVY